MGAPAGHPLSYPELSSPVRERPVREILKFLADHPAEPVLAAPVEGGKVRR